MAGKGGSRQQKQAAKAVRRRQTVAAKQQAERLASSLPGRIAVAAASPVERCLRLADMMEAGIGHVVLAKRLPSGALGCGFFLVDLLCLGVKDAFYREMAPSDLDEQVDDFAAGGQGMVAIDPASAKQLILDAVAFGTSCGMDPAKDFRTVAKVLDGIDAAASTETFTFGRDGKAVYVPGPNDPISKIRDIERRLIKARGQDGWDIDIMRSMSERERMAMHASLALLDQTASGIEDDLVIEHEGSTEMRDG
jgi:hypothetical protein